MPVKKMKKPKRARAPRGSAAEKKKGLKQKQKQKQVVNVQVSSGSGGSGGGYVPIPQAPEINYSLLSQLLRPAATVDVPIRAAAPVPEAPFMRPAEPLSLAEERERLSSQRRPTSQQSAPFIATPAASDFPSFQPSESEVEVPATIKKKGRPVGSKNKPRPIAYPVMSDPFERGFSQQSAPATYFDVPESGTESEENVQRAFERLKAKKAREVSFM